MHFLRHGTALLICSATRPLGYAFFPVPVRREALTADRTNWAMPEGTAVDLEPDDALRVRKYLQRHATVALTCDGNAVFVLDGTVLRQVWLHCLTQPPERVFASFQPHDWIAGEAVPVGQPESVDITEAVNSMPAAALAQLRDGQPSANALVDPQARGHYGPYSVLCEEAVCFYYRVVHISALTADIVAARARSAPPTEAVGVPYQADAACPEQDHAGELDRLAPRVATA